MDEELLTDDELMQAKMAELRRQNSASANTIKHLGIELAIARAQRDKLVRLGWGPRMNHGQTS